MVQGLVGTKAWAPWIGHGSFLTVEFGEPHEEAVPAWGGHPARTRYRGDWTLWVYCCMWRVDGPDFIAAASEDDRVQMEVGAWMLDGRTVTSLAVRSPGLDLAVEFNGGLVLRTFAIYSREHAYEDSTTFPEHWYLWTPGGRVIEAGPGSSWAFGDERRDKAAEQG